MPSSSFLELRFSNYPTYKLDSIKFYLPELVCPIESYRCSNHLFGSQIPSFRNTTTIMALCAAFLTIKLRPDDDFNLHPICEGFQASVAHTINRCIVQPRRFIYECFGISRMGAPLLNKIFAIYNSNLKSRLKPIKVFFRSSFLSPATIRIYLNDALVTDQETFQQLLKCQLEQFYASSKSPVYTDKALTLVA